MKSFLNAENFFIRKDSGFKTLSIMLLMASIALVFWLSSFGDEKYIANILEPLGSVMPLSILLYFILPLYVCFFSTEGFESGTVRNIIASGVSRSAYCWGKFISIVKVNLLLLLQFYVVFVIVFYLYSLLTGVEIRSVGLGEQALIIIRAIFYNILYLNAYGVVVLMLGFIVRKTSITTILTFAFVFGNLLIYGYWKDSSNPILRTISEYSLMTQVFKFSRIYVKNAENVLLSGFSENVIAILIPIILIIICLSVALMVLNKRDIYTS